MTTISNNSIAEAIYLATKNKTHEEQSLIFPRIVNFLFKKRLLSKAPDILSHLNKIINHEAGIIVAKVSGAKKLNENAKKELTRFLTKHYSAKEIKLDENSDERLLGGFRIEVNDEVIDLTIKNKIGKLKEYLTQNA